MLTVKMLKPYYIKADTHHVRIILAYQYFSILIDNQVFHFVPMESKEIRINRKTKKIVNIEAKFAFQKGKDIIYIAMTDLVSLPDFLIQLHFIVESYYAKGLIESADHKQIEIDKVIEELEQKNIKWLIDQALDQHDETEFQELVKLLT